MIIRWPSSLKKWLLLVDVPRRPEIVLGARLNHARLVSGENQAPQLRGLLNGQGMDMGRSQVAALPASRRGESRGASEEPVSGASRRLYRVGLVDDYA